MSVCLRGGAQSRLSIVHALRAAQVRSNKALPSDALRGDTQTQGVDAAVDARLAASSKSSNADQSSLFYPSSYLTSLGTLPSYTLHCLLMRLRSLGNVPLSFLSCNIATLFALQLATRPENDMQFASISP